MPASNWVGKIVSDASAALDMGLLEKATICILHERKQTQKIKVQFNPQSYNIQRGLRVSTKKPIPAGDNTMQAQAVSPNQARLSVQLLFDTYTEYGLGQSFAAQTVSMIGAGMNTAAKYALGQSTNPASLDACARFLDLIKFKADLHTAPRIAFVWGTMNFQGIMVHQAVNYTMFARDGTPVRIALDITIVGEESKNLGENPVRINESPDRTKRRNLEYGEQLWMMADREYGNVSEWKTIASSNGILNPRKLSGAMNLKVPSIR